MSSTCAVPSGRRCCCAAAAAAVALKRATSRASSFAMCESRFFRVAACSSHCFSCARTAIVRVGSTTHISCLVSMCLRACRPSRAPMDCAAANTGINCTVFAHTCDAVDGSPGSGACAPPPPAAPAGPRAAGAPRPHQRLARPAPLPGQPPGGAPAAGVMGMRHGLRSESKLVCSLVKMRMTLWYLTSTPCTPR